jgi:hypothetical protein
MYTPSLVKFLSDHSAQLFGTEKEQSKILYSQNIYFKVAYKEN